MDQTIALKDGRRFGLAEFGAPQGYPVIALHGTPGSRLKYAYMDEEARQLGLRLISLDRWGYGGTSVPPQTTLSAFARDVGELASELKVERFSVLGLSGGGPFAYAIAAELGDRVTALALLSPVGAVADTPPEDLDAVHRLGLLNLARVPSVIRLGFGVYRLLLHYWPAAAVGVAGARACPADHALRDDERARSALVKTFRAGLADGLEGPVIDLRIFATPWDVDGKTIRARTRLWIGTEDRNVPVVSAMLMAEKIDGSELIVLQDQGHFWMLENSGQVLQWIAESVAQAAHASQP